jgi:urea carboxylase
MGISGFDVIDPGMLTTVQDRDGRRGLWGVGVPPSGAFDDYAFALANAAVGNPANAAGIETAGRGPVLRFTGRAVFAVAGATSSITLDGRPVTPGRVTVGRAGQLLDMGAVDGPGLRQYLAVCGGVDVPRALGSRATFVLGGFGGHAGRALRAGDRLTVGPPDNVGAPVDIDTVLPPLTTAWRIRVLPGPHGAPEHLTTAGVAEFFAAEWRVDHRSDRTGVRLIGPAPDWARTDGGEAGLHPSNIHDSAYPVGGIMLAGNTPVIVGPDGPSLGGFVVPAVVIRADRWMVGQLRPGDHVTLTPVTPDEAAAANAARSLLLSDVPAAVRAARSTPPAAPAATREASAHLVADVPAAAYATRPTPSNPARDQGEPGAADRVTSLANGLTARQDRGEGGLPPVGEGLELVLQAEGGVPLPSLGEGHHAGSPPTAPPLLGLPSAGRRPAIVARRSGDHHLLVELGPPRLDLVVRMWVRLLARGVEDLRLRGLTETVEGVRSVLFAVDERVLPLPALAEAVGAVWVESPDPASVRLEVREVDMPIAFDDPSVHDAMARYQRTVRPDAPWCPDNVEFIRRINDLEYRDDVFATVAAATYLVVGLGDVYLGAPVAVPLDPAHRLVTTKYDPARTWTPANAVGIGGVYLCVYGMEGPGGYQLLGRTVPVWRYAPGDGRPPWLLRHFDLLRFRQVGSEELYELRADIAAGRRELTTYPRTLTLMDLEPPPDGWPASTTAFAERRQAAFAAERARWAEAGAR